MPCIFETLRYSFCACVRNILKIVTFVIEKMKLASFSLFLDAFPPRPKMPFGQLYVALQWATLVTHHFFRAHIFDKNAGIEYSLWYFIYWHFICLITSKKNIGITHANHSATQRQFWQILKNVRASGTSIFSIFVLC